MQKENKEKQNEKMNTAALDKIKKHLVFHEVMKELTVKDERGGLRWKRERVIEEVENKPFSRAILDMVEKLKKYGHAVLLIEEGEGGEPIYWYVEKDNGEAKWFRKLRHLADEYPTAAIDSLCDFSEITTSFETRAILDCTLRILNCEPEKSQRTT